MNIQVKRLIGHSLGGSHTQELLYPWNWTALPTNLEAQRTPYNWNFMEASSLRHDKLLTPFLAPSFPAPLPSLEDWSGLKTLSFSSDLVFLVTSPQPGAP